MVKDIVIAFTGKDIDVLEMSSLLIGYTPIVTIKTVAIS